MKGKILKSVLLVLLMFCAAQISYAQYYSDELVLKAEAGDIDSQLELGYCYYSGEGVAQDYAKAVKWWLKAAEAGDEMAQFNMSLCYGKGNGVPQDPAEALMWLTKSAEQGLPEAQFNLGLCYLNGVGAEQDQAEGAKWFTKAAEQGLQEAQFNLGLCYYEGNGVAQDYGEALEWWAKAAEQGDAKAHFYIGLCYLIGDGVEQDQKEAVDWITMSAILGYPNAMEMLRALEPGDAPDDEAVEEVAEEEEESKSLNDIRFAGWTDKDWLNNDYIRELRKYIDAYNRGEIENPDLDEYKDIIKGKFVIGDIQPYIMGGVFIQFLFIDYPQVCFETGVYSDVDEEREVVTGYHVVSVRCIGDDMDWMSKEDILETMKEHPELIAW